MYITRLASNEIFSPSNKIHREVSKYYRISLLTTNHGTVFDKHIAHLVINNHLLFMSLLNVSTCTKLAKLKYIERHRNTANFVKGLRAQSTSSSSSSYRGADKSLARPGRKQVTATDDFDVFLTVHHSIDSHPAYCTAIYRE